MIINVDSKKIELVNIWFEYLYPYLIRFCINKQIGIEWKNNIITIPTENKNDFIEMLKNIFEELMNECYVEPTHKQRSKYPTRYQKVEFKGKQYVLNYRTDIVGIIGYALYFLINEIGKDGTTSC